MHWYVTDFYERFHAIPVTVTARSDGRLDATWHLGDGITEEYRSVNPLAIHEKKEVAEISANCANFRIKARAAASSMDETAAAFTTLATVFKQIDSQT